MKILKLLFIVILVVKANKADDLEKGGEEEDVIADQSVSLEDVNIAGGDNDDDDVKGRQLQEIQLYTNDERCNDRGVCSGLDYGDSNVVVTFAYKEEIHIISKNTYEIEKPINYRTLTFINSKFANFPLQLFYAFKIKELDFRNCSVEILKWDNFLSAGKLSILLLSENLLKEIKPSLFSLAENLTFLFLDSNLISILHNDSFRGLEKLNYLDLHNNLIETLPSDVFSHLPAVQEINLNGNRIKLIDDFLFEHNSHLLGLHLQGNALTEIQEYAFKNQNNLKYLDISHNADLEALVVANVRVENLWAKNCSLYRINIYGEAVHVDLQQNSIKELYFSRPEYLETLRLRDNALEQISSLALTANLKILDVSNNPDLRTLPDLFQVNSLERLDLSNTSLKKIPLSVLASPNKLRSLNVSYNQIEEVDPLKFKYLVRLSQFYIHHNNWNCYYLQMLMDMIIKPLQISYTHDAYEDSFPGEYIHGIKCIYRIEPADDEYYVDSPSSQQSGRSNPKQVNSSPVSKADLSVDNSKEVDELRREVKAIIGIYEDKFSLIWNKLNELDLRLKEFERFNQTMWKQISIVV